MGLLTTLTFTRLLLLPVHIFFTMEGGDSDFAKFTLPTLNAFLKAHSQNMFGNKQQLVARATGCPKPHLFSANSQFSGQPKNNVNTFPL